MEQLELESVHSTSISKKPHTLTLETVETRAEGGVDMDRTMLRAEARLEASVEVAEGGATVSSLATSEFSRDRNVFPSSNLGSQQ